LSFELDGHKAFCVSVQMSGEMLGGDPYPINPVFTRNLKGCLKLEFDSINM